MPSQNRRAKPGLTASTADPHRLYEASVQSPDAELEFVEEEFRKLVRRPCRRLREDFCGTAYTSTEWVKRSPANTSVGLDLDRPTLDWGRTHHLERLTVSQQKRVRLLERNVLTPGPGTGGMDAVLAMNFSYWIFKTRAVLLSYFRAVHRSLASDGVFFMDCCGGWESLKTHREVRPLKSRRGPFTYIWHQDLYNPITGDIRCHINFRFPDQSRLRHAFTYDWRLWHIPEIRDVLADAGFARSTVYWEGDDNKGGGNGVFTPTEQGEDCASFIAYIVAEKKPRKLRARSK
jgi:hypothetical protein